MDSCQCLAQLSVDNPLSSIACFHRSLTVSCWNIEWAEPECHIPTTGTILLFRPLLRYSSHDAIDRVMRPFSQDVYSLSSWPKNSPVIGSDLALDFVFAFFSDGDHRRKFDLKGSEH